MVPIIELGKRFKKLQKRANYIDFIDEPVKGLVPVGDTGLYVTPDEPADPTDCDRYPSSPFCGGNPFTTTLINITPQIVIGDCDIGVRLTPVLGFIKLPPVNLVYRKPECREPPEKLNKIIKYNLTLPTYAGLYSTERSGTYNTITTVYNIKVQKIISVEKIPGVYLRREGIACEDWLVFYKDENGNIQQMWNDNAYENDWIYTRLEHLNELLDIEAEIRDGAVRYISGSVRNRSTETEGKVISIPYSYFQRNNYYPYATVSPAINFSPPPPPKEICCMPQCCPPPDNDLLKVLIKKVNKLSEIVGVEEYPATLPASLISKDEGFLGNLIPNPDKKIPNLTQLLGWYIERFDEIMGQFEIPIEVKDSDPTIPGDQPLGMKLPNVAESIAEMMGLLLQSTINTESLISLTTRTLIESGQDKQQNYLNYMLLQAVVDYLGFNFKENKVKLPMAFTPGKEKLEELLKETTLDIAVPEFDEKFNFQTDLIRLKEAASIIKSVYFEKVNPFGDAKQEIIDKLKAARDLAKQINKDSEKEFEKFTSDAEIGFTNTTGITDSASPYGYPYANRPKIRDISPSDSNPST